LRGKRKSDIARLDPKKLLNKILYVPEISIYLFIFASLFFYDIPLKKVLKVIDLE